MLLGKATEKRTILTPDITILVVRKIREVDVLLRLSSTSKALRPAIWTSVITRPSFVLNHAAFSFMKEAKQHFLDKHASHIATTHLARQPCGYVTTGERLEPLWVKRHTARLSREIDGDNRFFSINFDMGDSYFALEFFSHQRGYYKIFPESGHIEHSENLEYHEYDPPHLLAKLVDMGLL